MKLQNPITKEGIRKDPQEGFDTLRRLRSYVSGLKTGGHIAEHVAEFIVEEIDNAVGNLWSNR